MDTIFRLLSPLASKSYVPITPTKPLVLAISARTWSRVGVLPLASLTARPMAAISALAASYACMVYPPKSFGPGKALRNASIVAFAPGIWVASAPAEVALMLSSLPAAWSTQSVVSIPSPPMYGTSQPICFICARGLELEQDGAPVARLLLLVAAARHGAAVRLELRRESVGDADAEHGAVVQHADVVDVEGLVGVCRHRGTLVVVSGDDAEVVVRVTCSQVLRVVAARRQVLGQAGVGVRRADHREVLRGRDWNLGLGDRRVVRPDHAQELAVAQHALDVLDPGVCRIRGLPAVVEALVGDGVSVDSACAVLLVDGELDAIGGRLAADRTNGKVRSDLDRAFRPGATAATATRERDERCNDEDSESPSSNHMVTPCVCREARRNPSW